MGVILLILIYLVCGSIAGWSMFRYFQDKYPMMAEEEWGEDVMFGVVVALFPPAWIAALIVAGGAALTRWRRRRRATSH